MINIAYHVNSNYFTPRTFCSALPNAHNNKDCNTLLLKSLSQRARLHSIDESCSRF